MPKWLKKLFFIRLVLGLSVIAFLWWFYNYLGNKLLLPIATGQIRQLATAKITLKGINFHLGGAVSIDELLIKPPKPEEYDNTIIEARGVYARFKITSMLILRPRLKEIIAEDLLLNFQYDADSGRWNIECLKPPKGSRALSKWPVVIVKKAMVKCSSISKGEAEEIFSLDGEAKLSKAFLRDVYTFSVATVGSTGRLSNLEGSWSFGRRGGLVLQGGISSLRLPAFDNVWNLSNLDVKLEYDDKDNVYVRKLGGRLGSKTWFNLLGTLHERTTNRNFEIQAGIIDLFSTSEPVADAFVYNRPLLEKLEPLTRGFFSRYNPNGLVDIELKATGSLNQLSKTECLGRVVCKDVSFCYKEFPYRIEHLSGSIDFTQDSAILKNLLGRSGDVEIAVNGYTQGFGRNRDCRIRVTCDKMLLDDKLYRALNDRQKRVWQTFSPGGAARVDCSLICRPGEQGRRSELTIELLGGRASYQHIPYPLNNLSGRLYIEPNMVRLYDVTSSHDSRRITVNGEVAGLGTGLPKYNILIDAEHIPIDSTLKAALPEREKQFYEQFDVNGFINVQARVFNYEEQTKTLEYIANATVDAERLSFGLFPLSVTNVSAKATVTPDLLRIEELAGVCGSGNISLSGKIWPRSSQDETIGYCLFLRAEQLEISDDLVRALSEGPAKVLAQLQGQGRLNVSAELSHNAAEDCPPFKIVVDCLGNSINFEKFYYPLEDLRGTLTVTKDGVYLSGVTALAAGQIQPRTNIAGVKLDGRVKLDGADFQTGQFSFSANDIFFDQRLAAILDFIIPNVYEDVSPSGRFDLDIKNLSVFRTDDGRDSIDFNGRVVFKDCAFGPEQIINRLDGVLDSKWLYVEGLGFSSADVSLRAETLEVKGESLSGVRTKIHYVPEKEVWVVKDFVADCYDGKVTADFKLQQLAEGDLSYSAWLGFEDIELKEFLLHRSGKEHQDREYTSGRMNGSLSVLGLSGDNSARTGRLKLNVCDMQVGRLSILDKMLSVLTLAAPGDFAFDSMAVDAYIKKNQLLFEQINIHGKSLCLRGSGRMDLLTEHLDLSFTVSDPQVAGEPSLIASLAEGLAPAAVEMKVTGHFDNPEIKTTTLPVIKHSLGVLGSRPVKED